VRRSPPEGGAPRPAPGRPLGRAVLAGSEEPEPIAFFNPAASPFRTTAVPPGPHVTHKTWNSGSAVPVAGAGTTTSPFAPLRLKIACTAPAALVIIPRPC